MDSTFYSITCAFLFFLLSKDYSVFKKLIKFFFFMTDY